MILLLVSLMEASNSVETISGIKEPFRNVIHVNISFMAEHILETTSSKNTRLNLNHYKTYPNLPIILIKNYTRAMFAERK